MEKLRGDVLFSLGQVREGHVLFSLGQVLGLLCARMGAVQSCGIYLKSTSPYLRGVLRTLRKF